MQIHQKSLRCSQEPIVSQKEGAVSVTFAGDPVSLPAPLVATDEGVLWAFPQIARLTRVRGCVQVRLTSRYHSGIGDSRWLAADQSCNVRTTTVC